MGDYIEVVSFTLLYISFPVVILSGMWLGGINVLKFGIETFAILSCLVFGYAGLIFIFFGMDPYPASLGVNDRSIMMMVLLGSGWSIASLAAGSVIARAIFPGAASPSARSDHRGCSAGEICALIVLLCVCLAVLFLYLHRIKHIALFSMINGESAHRVAQQRSAMGNGFPGRYYLYKLFMHDMLWCVSLTLFCSLITGRRVSSAIIFMISAFAMIFTTTMAGEKSLVGLYLLSLFFSYILIKKEGYYLGVWLIVVLLGSFLAILLMYMMVYNIGIGASLLRAASRAFIGGVQPAYYYMEFFPDRHEYLLGRSFPILSKFFDYEYYPLTVKIMEWISPQNKGYGVVGSAPTIFWGEIYANFGYYGVMIMPIFVGIWLGLVSSVTKRFAATPIASALLVWLSFHFMDLSATGVSSFIFDYRLVAVVSVLVIVAVLGKIMEERFFLRRRTKADICN